MAYRLSEDAEADLDEIWLHIVEEGGAPTIAQRLVGSITVRFDTLSDHPRVGRRRDELRPGTRSHIAGDYLIFYRIVEDDDVLVLRVLHGRRDIEAMFHER
jgi:toxin ParE1/3/4